MLSVFLPIGWPTPKKFAKLAVIAVENGAGALELGIPYSDPVADGPVLQAAYREALADGSTTDRCLDSIAAAAAYGVPLNLLVYANLVHARPDFMARAKAAGATSLLVPTLRCEAEPDQVAALRSPHHASTPHTSPQSVSVCWLSAVIAASTTSKRMASAGLASNAPASTFTSISLPEPTPSSAA